jgi:hypothetical protein
MSEEALGPQIARARRQTRVNHECILIIPITVHAPCPEGYLPNGCPILTREFPSREAFLANIEKKKVGVKMRMM